LAGGEVLPPENNIRDDHFVLMGRVTAVSDLLEIEVIDSDYAFGIYWVLVFPQTLLCDSDGNTITLSDIKEGDIVEVTYSGQTMMSFPPQIAAQKIILK
jgi:hypothetical protein